MADRRAPEILPTASAVAKPVAPPWLGMLAGNGVEPWGLLTSYFGIDLGTANTVVCRRGGQIVLNEPSVMVVASNGSSHRPARIGHAAREMIGRTPVGMMAIRPMRDGVITDLESARAFIVAILSRVTPRRWERIRIAAVIGVPADATALERRALSEACSEAGIGRVWLMPEGIAGAIGSGLDPLGPRAHLVIDVGGGTAEVTGFCAGGILTHRTSRVAGDEMTTAVYQHLRRVHQIVVGELTAEDAKMGGQGALRVEGRDTASGRPKVVSITADEVAEAIRSTSETIIRTLADCLEDLPPQVVGDIMTSGLLAFGGASLLNGFAQLLEDAFGLRVRVADRPLTCVAEGAAACLGRAEMLAAYARR